MTKTQKRTSRKRVVFKRRSPARGARKKPPGAWMLHDAKARFSELVRLANTAGPQCVTVHGREQVVVLSAAEYEKLKGARSGRLLVDLMRKSPLRDVEFNSPRVRSPVRDVEL